MAVDQDRGEAAYEAEDTAADATRDAADLERRFGGLQRLYGAVAYARLRAASVAVVGLGGVGSWTVEALARSGVAQLVLIDLDHVSESNVNRQVQATTATLGQLKGQALRDRVIGINPRCKVHVVDAFVDADHWPALLPVAVDVLVDACDQVRAKATLAAWGAAERVPVVCVGAAGGKQQPQCVEVADLADVTHDPLLASLRQRLRQHSAAPRRGPMGLRCVFSREPVAPPAEGCGIDGNDEGTNEASTDGSLNCHGYGSSVTVTASFGMVAAAEAMAAIVRLSVPAVAVGVGQA